MLVEQKHLMRFFLEKWKASDALPSEPVVYNVAHNSQSSGSSAGWNGFVLKY